MWTRFYGGCQYHFSLSRCRSGSLWMNHNDSVTLNQSENRVRYEERKTNVKKQTILVETPKLILSLSVNEYLERLFCFVHCLISNVDRRSKHIRHGPDWQWYDIGGVLKFSVNIFDNFLACVFFFLFFTNIFIIFYTPYVFNDNDIGSKHLTWRSLNHKF